MISNMISAWIWGRKCVDAVGTRATPLGEFGDRLGLVFSSLLIINRGNEYGKGDSKRTHARTHAICSNHAKEM